MNSKSFQCRWEGCSLVFETEIETYFHLTENHGIPGRFPCLWRLDKGSPCNASQRHRGILRDHAVTHFSLDLRPFNCFLCGLPFRTCKSRRDHVNSDHKFNITNSFIPASQIHDVIHCDIGISAICCIFN